MYDASRLAKRHARVGRASWIVRSGVECVESQWPVVDVTVLVVVKTACV